MKKLLIGLTVLFSILFINDVSAKTEEKQSTYYLNIYREFINDGYENLDDFDKAFEEFYSSYKTTYPYYMISFYDMGSYVYVSYFLFSEKPNFQYLVYNSGSTNSMIWTYSSIGTFNAIYEKDTFTISPSTSYSTMVSSFANSSPYATTNSYFSWNFLQTQSFSSNGYEYYKNKIYFIYDCNFDITKADDNANNSSRTNVDLYIDGYYYQAGDIIPSYKDTLIEEPEVYQYNEKIDTTNLSYIRVDFDTTGTTYEDYNFINIDNVTSSFKEAYIETSWDYGVCVDVDHCYEKYIHRNNLNYLSTQNNYYMLSTFKYEDTEHGFYDETQELDYYYLYIDVSDSNDVIDFLIESTATFSVSFGYLEDYEDTFTKLNLKNYSGILLYPKSNVYNGNYIFYLENANINILKYNNDKIVNKYENIFSATVEIEKMEYYMFNRFYLIENNKINEDSYISFDNKYFVYKLVENSSDSIIITNPNTNKDEYIDSINNSNLIYESQKEYENIFDMINQGQIDNSIINVFTNVYNEFRKGLLGIYIFTIIIFSIILLLLNSAKR